jgi:hypothetical protein
MPSRVISSRSLSQHGLQQEWNRREFGECQVRWCVRHLPPAGAEVIGCKYSLRKYIFTFCSLLKQKNESWQLLIITDEVNIHNFGNPSYKWHWVCWWSTYRRHRVNYKSHSNFLMKTKPRKTDLFPACPVCIIFFSLWIHLAMLDTTYMNMECHLHMHVSVWNATYYLVTLLPRCMFRLYMAIIRCLLSC